MLGSAHPISDDDPAFPGALDLEELNDGSVALEDIPHDILIQIEGVFGGLVEEGLVTDGTNVDLAVRKIDFGKIGGERAARDEVAAQMPRVYGCGHARRAVRFDPEGLFGVRRVEEEVIDPGKGDKVRHVQTVKRVRVACLFSQCAPGPLVADTPGWLV